MAILRGLCTVEQVANIVWPDVPWGADTIPTLKVVEAWIDEDIDMLYPIFRAHGIITPVVEPETKRLVAVLQAKRVAGRIENFQHFDHGQATSPYGDRTLEEARALLDLILTGMVLPASATNEKRLILPQMVMWSKMVADIWDSSKEDTIKKEPMFKSGKEF
jgi:hypothetical protein